MLTKKQRELLTYMDKYVAEKGISPSYDEMKDAVGLNSKSGIHRIITALVDRGYIEKKGYRARAIRIIRGPNDDLRENFSNPVLAAHLEVSIGSNIELMISNKNLKKKCVRLQKMNNKLNDKIKLLKATEKELSTHISKLEHAVRKLRSGYA